MQQRRRILALCYAAYLLAYTLRVNIAVIIPAVVSAGIYSYTQMGIVTGIYFSAYMVGQLISGYLGDRLPSKLLIINGLALSAACNLLMASAPEFPLTAVLWGINGLAQSMLWPPIMKTLADWFPKDQLESVSFTMARSYIFGYALSWGASALLVRFGGWQLAFIFPASAVLVYAVILLIWFQSAPEAPSHREIRRDDRNIPPLPLWKYFAMIHLPVLLLVSLCQGFIREGISIWFPSMLEDLLHPPASFAWIILMLAPLINLAGIAAVRSISTAQRGNSFRTLPLVFALIAAASLLLPFFSAAAAWPTMGVLVLLLALSHGLTPVLTAVIPFQFVRFGRVSFTAGVLNFAIYLGAALTNAVTGMTTEIFGWRGVMFLWAAAAAVGLAAGVRYYTCRNNRRKHAKDQRVS